MPIYEYKCGKCGEITKVVLGVVDNEAKIECSQCGSEVMEKVIPSTFAVMEGKSRKATSNGTSCCGTTDPCDNPKKCCSH